MIEGVIADRLQVGKGGGRDRVRGDRGGLRGSESRLRATRAPPGEGCPCPCLLLGFQANCVAVSVFTVRERNGRDGGEGWVILAGK